MKVTRKYKDGISSLEYGKIYDVIKKDNISIGGWIKRPSYLIENDNGYKVWYSAHNFKEVKSENFGASVAIYNDEINKSRCVIKNKKHKEDLYEIKSLLSKARHPYVKYSDDEKQMKLEASDSMFKAIDELLIKIENKINGC